MQDDLNLSTTTLSWVITAYPLTFGGCLLAAGRLADRVGRRRAFAAGLGVFGLASLACGLATSGGALLTARAVQGLGAALIAPPPWPCSRRHARTDALARAPLGWWTAAAAGGGASGWVVGGVLSGLLDWRWVFLVNVPLCAGALCLAPRVLTEWRASSPARPDLAGAALVTVGLASLVFAFTSAEARGPVAGETLAALAAAVVLLAAFARVEARAAGSHPEPARLLRRPGVVEPNVVAAVLTRHHVTGDVLLHPVRTERARAGADRGRPAVSALQPVRGRRLARRAARRRRAR